MCVADVYEGRIEAGLLHMAKAVNYFIMVITVASRSGGMKASVVYYCWCIHC